MMKLLTLVSLCVTVLCRSMPGPPPEQCLRIVSFQSECGRQVADVNMTAMFSRNLWHVEIVDEICRYINDHLGCVKGQYPFLNSHCPAEITTTVDAMDRIVSGICNTYKTDFAETLACLNEDHYLLPRIISCEKDAMKHVGGFDNLVHLLSQDCSHLDVFGSCLDLIKRCSSEYVSNLEQFMNESRDDACYVLKMFAHLMK